MESIFSQKNSSLKLLLQQRRLRYRFCHLFFQIKFSAYQHRKTKYYLLKELLLKIGTKTVQRELKGAVTFF